MKKILLLLIIFAFASSAYAAPNICNTTNESVTLSAYLSPMTYYDSYYYNGGGILNYTRPLPNQAAVRIYPGPGHQIYNGNCSEGIINGFTTVITTTSPLLCVRDNSQSTYFEFQNIGFTAGTSNPTPRNMTFKVMSNIGCPTGNQETPGVPEFSTIGLVLAIGIGILAIFTIRIRRKK